MKAGRRLASHLLLTFLAVFCIGLLIQVAIPFVAPSISVAYLDTRVFQSWTGFGLRETLFQSLVLTMLLSIWYRLFLRLDSNASDREHRRLLITGFLSGALTVYLGVLLTIRVPALVVTVWMLQTTLQLIAGCFLLVRLNRKPHTWRWKALAALGLIGIMVLAVVAALAFPAPLPSETFTTTVAKRTIAIDYFEAENSIKTPQSIVIFHGVEGATPIMRRSFHYINARAIRDLGYDVYFVRYFDGMGFDDVMLTNDEGVLDADIIANYLNEDERKEKLIRGVSNAFSAIKQHSDSNKLGVIAYSLGCYVSFGAISQMPEDSTPDFLIANFGAAWDDTAFYDSFPPTVFFHGQDDEVIKLDDVERTVKTMKSSGVQSVELNILPGQGHVPVGPASYQLRLDTLDKIKQFFDESADNQIKTSPTTKASTKE